MLKKNCTIGIWWLPKWNSISFFPFPFEFPFCHRTCPFKAGSYRVTLLTILLMRDCWSTNQKIFQVDQQRYFPIFNFRLWQADGCGELVRPRRTQSSLLLDRWIWERRHQQCESILHNTFNVEKPQWPTNAQMFSWNMSGNPMEQYFTEWESGYPKNRCKNFFPLFTCFFYLNLHRTCELWVLQCSR